MPRAAAVTDNQHIVVADRRLSRRSSRHRPQDVAKEATHTADTQRGVLLEKEEE